MKNENYGRNSCHLEQYHHQLLQASSRQWKALTLPLLSALMQLLLFVRCFLSLLLAKASSILILELLAVLVTLPLLLHCLRTSGSSSAPCPYVLVQVDLQICMHTERLALQHTERHVCTYTHVCTTAHTERLGCIYKQNGL